MKVKFLQTRIVQAEGGETFVKDHVYDLPEASARRWIERAVAVESPEAPIGAPPAAQGNLLDKVAKVVKNAVAPRKKGVQA